MQEVKGVIAQTVALATPICEALGLILWDVEFKKEGSDYVLRIFIDKEQGGIDILDCENVSNGLDGPLDEMDYIEESYCLEVSSPGADRLLRLPEHYEAFIGCEVDVKLYKKINDTKKMTGILKAYQDGTITLCQTDGTDLSLEEKDRVSVKVHFEF